jgi:protein TonB
MRLGLLLFAVLLLRLEPVAGQDQEATVDDPGIGVSLPKIVESVGPGYTSEAMRAKIQGWNMVEAIVRPDGTVSDVRVVRSLDSKYELDERAVAAVSRWIFKPGTKDGKAVAVRVTIKFAFSMDSKGVSKN